jgi:hypothetical protein
LVQKDVAVEVYDEIGLRRLNARDPTEQWNATMVPHR